MQILVRNNGGTEPSIGKSARSVKQETIVCRRVYSPKARVTYINHVVLLSQQEVIPLSFGKRIYATVLPMDFAGESLRVPTTFVCGRPPKICLNIAQHILHRN